MRKVFLHTHDAGSSDWENKIFEFGRIPSEGEYVTKSVSGEWYQVELVVHTPFSDSMSAEVYAVKVDHHYEMNRKVDSRLP